MIYRKSELTTMLDWEPETNPAAGAIARDFLQGECELLLFTRTDAQIVSEISAFLNSTEGLALSVQRAETGELLVTAKPWSETILLTGRTADVLRGYLDNQIVRMADRFEMTVRQSLRAV